MNADLAAVAAQVLRERLREVSAMPLKTFIDGMLRKSWDDATRRVIEYDAETGEPSGTRPYTEEEVKAAEARQAYEQSITVEAALTAEVDNQIAALRATIGAGDAPAGTDTLNAIINTPNATINSGPAPYVKALARALRELTRATIRLARLAARDLDTPAE